jgi:hypothetical protein
VTLDLPSPWRYAEAATEPEQPYPACGTTSAASRALPASGAAAALSRPSTVAARSWPGLGRTTRRRKVAGPVSSVVPADVQGNRRGPHRPTAPAYTPGSRAPHERHRPCASRWYSRMSYQSRTTSASPHPGQHVVPPSGVASGAGARPACATPERFARPGPARGVPSPCLHWARTGRSCLVHRARGQRHGGCCRPCDPTGGDRRPVSLQTVSVCAMTRTGSGWLVKSQGRALGIHRRAGSCAIGGCGR